MTFVQPTHLDRSQCRRNYLEGARVVSSVTSAILTLSLCFTVTVGTANEPAAALMRQSLRYRNSLFRYAGSLITTKLLGRSVGRLNAGFAQAAGAQSRLHRNGGPMYSDCRPPAWTTHRLMNL